MACVFFKIVIPGTVDHGLWTMDHSPLIQELSHQFHFYLHIHTEFGDGDTIIIGFSIMRFDLLHEHVCSPPPAACDIFHILCIHDVLGGILFMTSVEIFHCC